MILTTPVPEDFFYSLHIFILILCFCFYLWCEVVVDLSDGVTYLHGRRRMRAGPSSIVRSERVSSSKRWRISSARETTGARVRMWYVWTQARWSRSVRSKLHCGRRTQQQHCGGGGGRVAGQVARGAPGTETPPTNPDAPTARRVLPSAPISAPISRLICVGYVTAAPLGALVPGSPPPTQTTRPPQRSSSAKRRGGLSGDDGRDRGMREGLTVVRSVVCCIFSPLAAVDPSFYLLLLFFKTFLPHCGCRARRVRVPPSDIDLEKKRARARITHSRQLYYIIYLYNASGRDKSKLSRSYEQCNAFM